ncbi:uncharacterized protein LOC141893846 [Acropora palmata]|uniref:uncharacterized protein LOC141893846 n=1 Tax=Acropora palmata TaxID=6131 RepID=UPI003DA0161F
MISDAQFEKMGLAIGQVAMMKALLAAEDKEGEEAKEQNKERIRTLVDKIRKKGGDQEKRKPLSAQARTVKKQPIKKQRKMYIGWLHRSSNDSRFKQVRMKDGGGVRDYTYNDDDHITVDFLKADAKKLFFSGGNVQARCCGRDAFRLG